MNLNLNYFKLFCREEAVEYIEIGTINGLFVLGRCTGFIGTNIDLISFAYFNVIVFFQAITWIRNG